MALTNNQPSSNLIQPSNKKFICNISGCGKEFSTVYKLTEHDKWHKGDFECGYQDCDNNSSTRSRQIEHAQWHEGKFKCTNIGCTHSSSNSTHLKTHIGRCKKNHLDRNKLSNKNKISSSDRGRGKPHDTPDSYSYTNKVFNQWR